MSDYKPRIKKTAENWVRLFILAHGKSPSPEELPIGEFEDMVEEESDEWRALRAKIQVALGVSDS